MILFTCNRKYYEKNAISQLERWGADLEEIINKTKYYTTSETEVELSSKIEELSSKYMESKTKVEEMLNSPYHNWENEKNNYERLWSEVAPSFYKARKTLLN